MFKQVLAKHLSKVFNRCISDYKLPPSWKEARIIFPIPKSGKNLSDPSSYRPISLLNTDYKILTIILASRLNFVLGSYIHMDQTGFVKNKHLGYNVRWVLIILKHIYKHRIPSILYFIDTEKAFDRVEWKCMRSVLNILKVGTFIQT